MLSYGLILFLSSARLTSLPLPPQLSPPFSLRVSFKPPVKLVVLSSLPLPLFLFSLVLYFPLLLVNFLLSHFLSLLIFNFSSACCVSLRVSLYPPAKISTPPASLHFISGWRPSLSLSLLFFLEKSISILLLFRHFSRPPLYINSVYFSMCSWHLAPPIPCSLDKKSIILMVFLNLEEIESRIPDIDFIGLGELLP